MFVLVCQVRAMQGCDPRQPGGFKCYLMWLERWSGREKKKISGAHLLLFHLFKNRNLPHRLAETDCWAVCPWRVPRKQCGGHQRATHHGRPEGEQTAVLSEPVTHGNCPSSPGSIINWNPKCWYASSAWGAILSESALFRSVPLCHKWSIPERDVWIDFKL